MSSPILTAPRRDGSTRRPAMAHDHDDPLDRGCGCTALSSEAALFDRNAGHRREALCPSRRRHRQSDVVARAITASRRHAGGDRLPAADTPRPSSTQSRHALRCRADRGKKSFPSTPAGSERCRRRPRAKSAGCSLATPCSASCRRTISTRCCCTRGSSTIRQAARFSPIGSPGRSMMAILKAGVRISAPSPAGPDIVLTILQAR